MYCDNFPSLKVSLCRTVAIMMRANLPERKVLVMGCAHFFTFLKNYLNPFITGIKTPGNFVKYLTLFCRPSTIVNVHLLFREKWRQYRCVPHEEIASRNNNNNSILSQHISQLQTFTKERPSPEKVETGIKFQFMWAVYCSIHWIEPPKGT
jgi:hypothetical protein